jgi:hypothetical protein
MDGYDVAQICLNGHVTNEMSTRYPQFNKQFCEKCGERTIRQCPSCNSQIRGVYHMDGVLGGIDYSPPGFCFQCGDAFPWTTSRVEAAKELADSFDQLSEVEREQLKASVDDLIRENTRTPVAQSKFRKVLAKVGKEGVDGMRNILVDVLSEAVKKSVFGP